MKPVLRKGFGIGGRIARTLALHPEPTFPFGSDEYWMEQALLESMESIGLSQPNPAVGCVLVQENHEIARGRTQAWKHQHAESVAFSRIDPGADLHRATAFVTLEPCSHQGFQPPCVELFLHSPIPRIVIAVSDPDPRVSGEGIRLLRAAGKEVVMSVLEPEARAWNSNFLLSKKTGRPVWAAKWAQNEAGYLCDADGNSKWITNAKARAHTHWLRQKYDAIVVGARTFLLDRPKLTVRDCAKPHHRSPERFIFDPKGRVLDLPLDERSGFRILVCESDLKARGMGSSPELISVPDSSDSPNLWRNFQKALESASFERPLQSVMVEGGPRLLQALLKDDFFTVVHRFTGRHPFDSVDEACRLGWVPDSSFRLQTEEDFNGDLLHEWIKED